MDTILDLLLVAVILVCAWTGYKKGIIMGIGGILVIVISLFGANLLSITFSYEVVPALRPFASGYMEKQIRYSVYDSLGIEYDDEADYEETNTVTETNQISEVAELSINDLIRENPGIEREVSRASFGRVGILASAAENMADEAVDYAQEHNTTLQVAIVEVLCERVTYVGGFLVFFVLILIVFTIAGNILNISFKIPNLDLVNDVGGAVLGVATGFMFCMVIGWTLKFTGLLISQETVAQAGIASWFIEKDLVGKYLSL